jgi:3',5'-cyclic-AMP phosphodiesterase
MRLILMSDAHVGLPETQLSGQRYEYTPALLRTAVERATALQPDEVILTGDLVNLGTAAECRLANDILAPLSKRLHVISGNHDVLDQSLADFAVRVSGAANNQVIDRGQCVLVLLNSAVEGLSIDQWHGRLNADALAALDAGIARAAGRMLAVFVHHPPAGTVRTANHPMMTLVNGHDLLDRIHRHAGHAVVFCGHNHLGDVHRAGRLTVIGLPAVAFWPHAIVVVDFVDGLMKVREERLIDDPARSPSFEARADEVLRRKSESTVPEIAIRI